MHTEKHEHRQKKKSLGDEIFTNSNGGRQGKTKRRDEQKARERGGNRAAVEKAVGGMNMDGLELS